jgi:hypothetical protein
MVLAVLSMLVILAKIELSVFTGVSIIWLFAFLMVAGGIESIIELTAGKLSIKRSVKEAKEANQEAQRIRDELREITRANVENAWILASASMLAAGGDKKARERLEKNLSTLSEFVEADKTNEDKWWSELRELFAHRMGKEKN